MSKTEECINALQEHIAGMAEHAFYAVLEMEGDSASLEQFMKLYTRQLEHVASEYLINQVLKQKSATFQSVKKMHTAKEVQKIINNS